MVYSVPQYLKKLTLAKRTAKTIQLYSEHFRYFAKFLGVPVEDLHNHLTKENLLDYAENVLSTHAPSSQILALSILRRYYKLNGVVAFDELEAAELTPKNYEEPDDKPLTLDMLKQIMAFANARERAMITTMISTGMRAGELCAIELNDIKDDVIRIRPEVTHQRGRIVYLTSEAREAIDVWLPMREDYKKFVSRKYYSRGRPHEDNRVFCCSYTSLKQMWLKLYNRIDGEKGKYHAKCTTHSCRKYFRTNAVHKMDLDLVEMLMGHEGYMTKSYRRIPEPEARKQFHEHEHTLYITRVYDREAKSEIEKLQKDKQALAEKIDTIEQKREEQLADMDRKYNALAELVEEMREGKDPKGSPLQSP